MAAGSSDGSDASSGAPIEGTTSTTSSSSSAGADESTSTGEPRTIPGEGPFGAGSRLQPVVERSDDAMRLLHWYDAELGLECELARDASGDLRCLPITTPRVDAGFADATCEGGVVQAATCASVPAWLRAAAPGSADCDVGARQLSYRRGAPIAAPDDFWAWDPWAGRCMSGGEPFGDHYTIDRATDDMFLAAQLVDEPGDGGLMIRAAVFDDGSFERVDLLDAASARPCSPQFALVDDAPVVQCRVDSIGRVGRVLAASDCSGDPLAVVVDDGSCDPPAFATDGVSWWEVGAAFEGSAFELVDGTCNSFVPGPTESVRALGAEIAAPAFAPIVRAAVPIGLRLQPYGVVIDDAPVQITRPQGGPAWYDATLESPCEAVALAGGGHVCAHAVAYAHDETPWGDPECAATPLSRLESGAPPPIVVSVLDDGCRTVADHARAVVGEWMGPLYRLDPRDKACAPVEREGDRYLQLGNIVQLADLPSLVVETLVP